MACLRHVSHTRRRRKKERKREPTIHRYAGKATPTSPLLGHRGKSVFIARYRFHRLHRRQKTWCRTRNGSAFPNTYSRSLCSPCLSFFSPSPSLLTASILEPVDFSHARVVIRRNHFTKLSHTINSSRGGERTRAGLLVLIFHFIGERFTADFTIMGRKFVFGHL